MDRDEEPNTDPEECAACGSDGIFWQPGCGWTCTNCGRTDGDEL